MADNGSLCEPPEQLVRAASNGPDNPELGGQGRTVWLCNTDVESEWAEAAGEAAPPQDERRLLFQRFEEILLSSAGSDAIAILRTAPDPQFLSYLEGLGLDLPEVMVPGGAEEAPWAPTARLVRDDLLTLRELASKVGSGRCSALEPFGVSPDIESIAAHTGLRLARSGASLAANLSRKSSARRLARQLGLSQPDGEICEEPAELPGVVRSLRRACGGSPVVIKPDLGASGRGQRLVRGDGDEQELATAVKRGELGGPGATHVVERWCLARATLTYEIHVDPAGRPPGPLIVREALGGSSRAHHGYVYPARIGPYVRDALAEAAVRLAANLRAEHGYTGPVRCDALVLDDGRVFPVLEMNARHSFFTFIDRIHARLSSASPGLFRWLFFRSPGKLTFETLTAGFIGADLLFDSERREGAVVPVFGTVTAAEKPPLGQYQPPLRRLFVLVLAPTAERAFAIADTVGQRLNASPEVQFP